MPRSFLPGNFWFTSMAALSCTSWFPSFRLQKPPYRLLLVCLSWRPLEMPSKVPSSIRALKTPCLLRESAWPLWEVLFCC
ncbi:RGD1562811 (predicted) [Rattus norvegicus]|uniref:RGD1562811 (Predicted) n=1 Tax=Rattus norvegicus TaxID=10116 RepID=A6J4H0_RAT|nr:RGD1562811 (predicted) [Rattus norvegicus]